MSTQICPNCEENIETSKFFLHERMCSINVKRCPKCNKPFNVEDLEEHISSHEVKISKKKEEDKKIVEIPCQYCSMKFSENEYLEHEKMCAARSEECPVCGNRIPLKDMEVHMNMCFGNENRDVEPNKNHISNKSKGEGKYSINKEDSKYMGYNDNANSYKNHMNYGNNINDKKNNNNVNKGNTEKTNNIFNKRSGPINKNDNNLYNRQQNNINKNPHVPSKNTNININNIHQNKRPNPVNNQNNAPKTLVNNHNPNMPKKNNININNKYNYNNYNNPNISKYNNIPNNNNSNNRNNNNNNNNNNIRNNNNNYKIQNQNINLNQNQNQNQKGRRAPNLGITKNKMSTNNIINNTGRPPSSRGENIFAGVGRVNSGVNNNELNDMEDQFLRIAIEESLQDKYK